MGKSAVYCEPMTPPQLKENCHELFIVGGRDTRRGSANQCDFEKF
jgi:hypothetical protein